MVGAAVRWSAMAGGVGDRFSSEEEGREAAVRDRRGEGKTAEGGGWVGKYVERKAVWEFARGGRWIHRRRWSSERRKKPDLKR